MGFNERVYELVRQIPYGKVASYGQVARMLGMPRGARQVGWAMSNCSDPDNTPWHRVVMADGTITGGEYAALRKQMLEAEGVAFLPDGRIDMKVYGVN